MKAVAVFPNKRQISVVNKEPPGALGEGEVRLKMLEVGVCGTDREIASFQYGIPPEGEDHLVIGHESLGEVVEVGKGVNRIHKGDLVVTRVRRPCNHPDCGPCRAGRQDFCITGDFTERGIKGRHGYMTEEVVDNERYMHVVPKALREIGVLTEPLTIAQKAIAELEQVHHRMPWLGKAFRDYRPKALVLGAGPVGLLGAMSFIEKGFDTYVYSRSRKPNEKNPIAEAIGAPYIAAEQHPPEELPEKVGHIDVVYEATGASAVSFEVLKQLGPNGVFVFTGVPGRKAPVPVDTDFIMRNMVLKNQILFGTVNAGPDAYDHAIAALQSFDRRWPEAIRSLITGRYPVEKALDLLEGRGSGIKDVITFA